MTVELWACFSPLYFTVHVMVLLKSVNRGLKVSNDTVSHFHSFSFFIRRVTVPLWSQESFGGITGQEWVTEQETVIFSLICTDTEGGQGSSVVRKYQTSITHLHFTNINYQEKWCLWRIALTYDINGHWILCEGEARARWHLSTEVERTRVWTSDPIQQHGAGTWLHISQKRGPLFVLLRQPHVRDSGWDGSIPFFPEAFPPVQTILIGGSWISVGAGDDHTVALQSRNPRWHTDCPCSCRGLDVRNHWKWESKSDHTY